MLRIAAAEEHHPRGIIAPQQRYRHRPNGLRLRQHHQQLRAVQRPKIVARLAQTLNTDRLKRLPV